MGVSETWPHVKGVEKNPSPFDISIFQGQFDTFTHIFYLELISKVRDIGLILHNLNFHKYQMKSKK